jgi:hypothetical protein
MNIRPIIMRSPGPVPHLRATRGLGAAESEGRIDFLIGFVYYVHMQWFF